MTGAKPMKWNWRIVSGADTDALELTPESAGL